MSRPAPPAPLRFGRRSARPLPPAGQRLSRRPLSPRFGDRANAWLRAVAEAWRPLVHRGADAAFVAAVRAAESAAARWWARGAPAPGSGAGTADPPAGLLALRNGLRRDGFGSAAAAQALGVVCAAARHVLGVRPFDSQLIGARALLDGRLAEMATGEGKTLTVALAAAVAALAGVPVHVVTANDYLVARDAAALRPLYGALGLSVGAVLQHHAAAQRAAAYACDIACVTAKELVFDHLRDSLLSPAERCLRRGLQLAIVDEADSILIDEARVPLQLSQPVDGAAADAALADADQALRAARPLVAGRDFRLDAGGGAVSARLTPGGRAAVFAAAASSTAPGDRRAVPPADRWRHPAHREHAVCTALAALHGLHRGRHYVVCEGRVLIVDETTGRVAPGRAWAAGLHTLVELKEGCLPQPPLVTVAQSSYPRFFGRYARLAGLSGTLRDARGELLQAYGLAVRRVPLRLPCRRRVLPHRLFGSHPALWQAVAGRVAALHREGRPVLVATDSVADAQALSAVLAARGLRHACLHAGRTAEPGAAAAVAAGELAVDSSAVPGSAGATGSTGATGSMAAPAPAGGAGPDSAGPPAAIAAAADEAAVVAQAGRRGAVTVSTNMAGRGTDIALDEHARAHGGLHVVCCQLNGARRIDRQLAGRAARQGDDGSVETWLSLDSALLGGLLPRGPLAAALAPWLPSPLVRLLARIAQRREERCQREQRRRLAAHDRLLQRQLGFGGPSSS